MTVTRGNKHASSYVITTAAKRTLLPVTITQGDQPADSNEIALTKSVADQLGVKVGDRVTVNSQAAQYAGKTGDSAVIPVTLVMSRPRTPMARARTTVIPMPRPVRPSHPMAPTLPTPA